MLNPILPDDQESRLKTLKELLLLDTSPEARFDMITHYAATLFEVPIAFISFIDADRLWFKSKCGIEILETPRAFSLCVHTMDSTEILLINDTLADPRYSSNPMVTGKPYIRFYAGAPITMPNNVCIGTLCVVDKTPKYPAKEQIEELAELARLVALELQGQKTSDCFPGCSNLKHNPGTCREFCKNTDNTPT